VQRSKGSLRLLATLREVSKSEVAQAARYDESNPAYPHRHRPAADHNWPRHVNSQQVEQRYYSKNYTCDQSECFLVHGSYSNGFRLHH